MEPLLATLLGECGARMDGLRGASLPNSLTHLFVLTARCFHVLGGDIRAIKKEGGGRERWGQTATISQIHPRVPRLSTGV
jgi:hypothetical protein